ncbi:CfaE/CblD family pilus tip adhesin [Edwardsiella tarda]|uniref:Uncharacterized protein n=1 Tax=Edwardsiella tarda ATCC 15947 = NBRC 105688 TaxID=667121 RepID=A0AC61TN25_EDWTA|nr:CfaE/CblD family pilus tip adhesin [Edwardsiella tarda]UAL58105.1 hypothetical protein K8O98_17230 [Edwardsiella tarda]UCQ02035.1 hypothetical protein DCL27_17165 [Edwardsiella tarda ATCC 15947 = NBRC 105688]
MNKFIKLIILIAVISWKPTISMASTPSDYSSTINIEKSYDLNSPLPEIYLWENKRINIPTPNGKPNGLDFFLSCLSDSNDNYGACPTLPTWNGEGSYVLLSFVEKKTNIKHAVVVKGTVNNSCSIIKFTGAPGGCPYNGLNYNVYIPQDELKKFPIGGVWFAHLKLRTGQWHAGVGSINDSWPGFMDAYWEANITLNITDNNNIRIWFPQFHGNTANIIMPIIPAYWASNTPSRVMAEKIIDTCLYDGYNSNSKTFQITFNSDDIDNTSQEFILRRATTPGESFLPYQIFVSSPGSSEALQMVKPGEQLIYSGMSSIAIRQVMMPGLPEPVACAPWSIKIKLKPFDLSKQQAGHYVGVLKVTFTPSLDK